MNTVDVLNWKLKGFLEHRFFKVVISAVIFANPMALASQTWTVFTAPSVEGISLTMWIIFVFIQTAMALEGIRVKSAAVFWSMLVSVCESTAIITAVLVRS